MDAGEGATASYMKGPAMARILCVDNYDSFVFTIVGYLRHLGAVVDVVRNDVVDPAWFEAGYDGVLISPGPGDPKSAGASLQTIADCAEREHPDAGRVPGAPVPRRALRRDRRARARAHARQDLRHHARRARRASRACPRR